MRIRGRVKKNITKNKIPCLMCGEKKHLVEIKSGNPKTKKVGIKEGFYANRCVRCYNKFCIRDKLGLSNEDLYGGNKENFVGKQEGVKK